MTIARHFNAGLNPAGNPSPGGTTGVFKTETIGNMKTVCRPFSRPGGTRGGRAQAPRR